MRMWILLFALNGLATAPSQAGESPFIIVSDIDDTVKITNTLHTLDKISNGLFNVQMFEGITGAYRFLLDGRTSTDKADLYFISGSPSILQDNITSMMEYVLRDLPQSQILLRDDLQEDIYDFKLRMLTSIQKIDPRPKILVGDDTEKDPEVYAKFRELHPESVLATYIHWVKGRKDLPPGQKGWVTALDFSISEMNEGRLKPYAAIGVGNMIRASQRIELYFPEFMSCERLPESETGCASRIEIPLEASLKSQLLELCSTLHSKIHQSCTAR